MSSNNKTCHLVCANGIMDLDFLYSSKKATDAINDVLNSPQKQITNVSLNRIVIVSDPDKCCTLPDGTKICDPSKIKLPCKTITINQTGGNIPSVTTEIVDRNLLNNVQLVIEVISETISDDISMIDEKLYDKILHNLNDTASTGETTKQAIINNLSFSIGQDIQKNITPSKFNEIIASTNATNNITIYACAISQTDIQSVQVNSYLSAVIEVIKNNKNIAIVNNFLKAEYHGNVNPPSNNNHNYYLIAALLCVCWLLILSSFSSSLIFIYNRE